VQVLEALFFVVPASLVLGAIGGEYARPVMTRKDDDSLLQSYFETRAQRDGTSNREQRAAIPRSDNAHR
jgi:hypothetical protein